MTKTFPKRDCRGAVHPHAGSSDGRGPHLLGHSDAAELAARLRDLALRAHRAVQDARSVTDGELHGELDALRAAILGLEADIRVQNLPGLAPYVEALRQQVEAQLG